MKRLIVGITVSAAALLAWASSAQAGGPWLLDTNGNGIIDNVQMDFYDDGTINLQGVDVDENGVADWVLFDIDNNAWYDARLSDLNQSGAFEILALDTNNDGQFDWELLDSNENLVWDHLEFDQPIPIGSAGLIGPITNPHWTVTAMTTLIGSGAMASLGPANVDGDLCPEDLDRNDRDPFDC